MRGWIIVPALALLIVCSACGEGGGTAPSESASPAAGGLCGLLPKGSVEDTAGYEVTLAQEHNGPGSLHYCTIFLRVAGCSECALSLEDLGRIDVNAYNDSDAYRATLIAANSDAQVAFQENVVGEGSWLATATSGEAAGLKILYFKAGAVAYDLTSPRVLGGLLTADQMVKLAQIVVGNGP